RRYKIDALLLAPPGIFHALFKQPAGGGTASRDGRCLRRRLGHSRRKLMAVDDRMGIRGRIGPEMVWHNDGVYELPPDIDAESVILYDVAVDVGQADRAQLALTGLPGKKP